MKGPINNPSGPNMIKAVTKPIEAPIRPPLVPPSFFTPIIGII